jgi:hypothetical protein
LAESICSSTLLRATDVLMTVLPVEMKVLQAYAPVKGHGYSAGMVWGWLAAASAALALGPSNAALSAARARQRDPLLRLGQHQSRGRGQGLGGCLRLLAG